MRLLQAVKKLFLSTSLLTIRLQNTLGTIPSTPVKESRFSLLHYSLIVSLISIEKETNLEMQKRVAELSMLIVKKKASLRLF